MDSLFAHIDDELNRPLHDRLAAAPEALRHLQSVAGIETYADLARDEAGTRELRLALERLEDCLRHPVCDADLPGEGWWAQPRQLRVDLLRTWLAADLLPRCADAATARASCDVGNLRLFQVVSPRADADLTDEVHRLAAALALDERDVATAMAEHRAKAALIEERRERVRRLVDGLFRREDDWDRAAIASFINGCFPGLDLRADEVDLVDAGTAIYLVVPDDAAAGRTGEAAAVAARFTKRLDRFRFERFNHFPVFSPLDVGNGDPATCRRIADILELPMHEAVERANRCMMLERRGHLPSYLVHDSWGHLWQALLLDYDFAYDQLAELQHPLGGDAAVADSAHRLLSLVDCLRPLADGTVQVDQALCDRFADGLLREGLRQLCVPVVAELTADMVEWCLRCDHPHLLPSSSAVAERPAKVDFALADTGYFLRQLGKGIDLAQRRETAREALVARLAVLLPGRWSDVLDGQAIDRRSLATAVDGLLDRLRRRRDHVLNDRDAIPLADGLRINDRSRLLLNILRLHAAINDCYQHLPTVGDQLRLRSIPILFVALRCRSHADAFWSCDEDLATCMLPFLRLVVAAG